MELSQKLPGGNTVGGTSPRRLLPRRAAGLEFSGPFCLSLELRFSPLMFCFQPPSSASPAIPARVLCSSLVPLWAIRDGVRHLALFVLILEIFLPVRIPISGCVAGAGSPRYCLSVVSVRLESR